MLNRINVYVASTVTETFVTKWIDSIFKSVESLGLRVVKAVAGLGTVISVGILIYLIFKTIMDTKSGNPEAWKESSGRIGVVAVLMVVLAVTSSLI